MGRGGRVSYTTRASRMPAGHRLSNYTGSVMTGSELAAIEANEEHIAIRSANADVQEMKHMLEVIATIPPILKMKDKRKRPRRVKKKHWKAARKLRLTRTKRPKRRKKPRPA